MSSNNKRSAGRPIMKVAVYERDNGQRGIGIVDGATIRDITQWVGLSQQCLLGAYIEKARAERPPIDGEQISIDEVKMLPPSIGANAIICVGVNYAEHARLVAERTGTLESTKDTAPALFLKVWSSLTGHNQPVVTPAVSDWLDFEGELAVIIGKKCFAVPLAETLDAVAGYSIGQDGSVRDWQRNLPTPTAGKNFNRSGALGPWMVTADEIPDPSTLRITSKLNGKTMQDAPVSSMIHDVPALIHHISQFIELTPGDVIFTGTPAGSYADRGNSQWLVPGDVIEIEIPGIGVLSNYVVGS
jgi:2-keto-4-pentenoate hydratase/2-oxohepta-3-ene-1,7-dioic acid hydratase in catechol pathway